MNLMKQIMMHPRIVRKVDLNIQQNSNNLFNWLINKKLIRMKASNLARIYQLGNLRILKLFKKEKNGIKRNKFKTKTKKIHYK